MGCRARSLPCGRAGTTDLSVDGVRRHANRAERRSGGGAVKLLQADQIDDADQQADSGQPGRTARSRASGRSGTTHGWIGLVTGSGTSRSFGRRFLERRGLPALHQLIHPRPRLGGHLHLLTEQTEYLMNAGHFGEVHVRGEALLLVLSHGLGIELVIQIARDDIGVGRVGARLLGTESRRCRVTR